MAAFFDRSHGIFPDLALVSRPDRRRNHASEYAAAPVVQAHAVLNHLFGDDAHGEGIKPGPSVLLRDRRVPETCLLDLRGDAPVIGPPYFGPVRAPLLFCWNHFFADDAPYLLAHEFQLLWQHVAVHR